MFNLARVCLPRVRILLWNSIHRISSLLKLNGACCSRAQTIIKTRTLKRVQAYFSVRANAESYSGYKYLKILNKSECQKYITFYSWNIPEMPMERLKPDYKACNLCTITT
jgi:hypothetical protein